MLFGMDEMLILRSGLLDQTQRISKGEQTCNTQASSHAAACSSIDESCGKFNVLLRSWFAYLMEA